MIFAQQNIKKLYLFTTVIVFVIAATTGHRIFGDEPKEPIKIELKEPAKISSSFSCEQASYDHFKPIDKYCEIQNVFDSCDEHTLVTFDVDDTLITANDVLARTVEHPLWFKICLAIEHPFALLKKETREKIIDDFINVLFQIPRFVFDPDIVRLIKQLQQKKCNAIGLTAIGSGSLDSIKNLPEWRANMLNGFGIDFSGVFADALFTMLRSQFIFLGGQSGFATKTTIIKSFGPPSLNTSYGPSHECNTFHVLTRDVEKCAAVVRFNNIGKFF